MSHEVEMWRRKCNVVQEKYQNIRSLLSKDKSIGVGRQSLSYGQDNAGLGEKKMSGKTGYMLEEINEMANQLEHIKMRKNTSNAEEQHY